MPDPTNNPFLNTQSPQSVPAPATAGANPFLAGATAAPDAAPGSEDRYALGEVPGQAAANFLPSLGKKASAIGEAVTEHPLETATAVAESMPRLIDFSGHNIKLAAEMAKQLQEKYGSWDKVKTTAAEHPDEFLMDAMSVLPLGGWGSATTRAGKIGQRIGQVAETADPSKILTTLRRASEAGGKAASWAADQAAQAFEGIGTGALSEMFQSGKAVTPGVWKTLTHGLDFEKSYDMIKSSLGNLFSERHTNYDAQMSAIAGADKAVDFAKVDNAVNDAAKIGQYKAPGDNRPGPGYQYERDPSVMDARARIIAEVQRYKMMGPAYHTAFGFDKLKQAIRTIGDGLEDAGMPTRGSAFAHKVEGAVKKTIMDEVPEYGKAMHDYGTATDEIKGLIKEFSLQDGNKLATLRKLQKVWRQSADVAHGERTNQLRKAVEGSGNEALMSHLAAGQFNPWTPRGLRGTFLPMEAMMSPGKVTAMMPLMSPRITGSTAYGLGRLAGSPVGRGAGAAFAGAEKVAPAASRLLEYGLPQPNDDGDREAGFFRQRSP